MEENDQKQVPDFDLLHKTLCDSGCEIIKVINPQTVAFSYEGMPYMAKVDELSFCILQLYWYSLKEDDPYLGLMKEVIEKANQRKASGVNVFFGKPEEDGTVAVHCRGIMPNHIHFYDVHNVVKCIRLMSIMKEWVTSHFLLFVNHECQHWPDSYTTCYK